MDTLTPEQKEELARIVRTDLEDFQASMTHMAGLCGSFVAEVMSGGFDNDDEDEDDDPEVTPPDSAGE
jgi:hypothetical protein